MTQIKSITRNLIGQVRAFWKYLFLYYYLPVFVILFAAWVLTVIKPSVKPEDLFRDITALAGLPIYTGFVSQLGILLWAASVTSCLIARFLLEKFDSGSLQSRRFLLHAGLFSAFLMFDDMFLFHEEIAAGLLSINQKVVYMAYLLIALIFLYFNRNEILSSEYLPFVIAIMAFGLSIFMDVVTDTFFEELETLGSSYETYEVFFEDGLKFIGIATWLAFYLRYIYHVFIPVFEWNRKY